MTPLIDVACRVMSMMLSAESIMATQVTDT